MPCPSLSSLNMDIYALLHKLAGEQEVFPPVRVIPDHAIPVHEDVDPQRTYQLYPSLETEPEISLKVTPETVMPVVGSPVGLPFS
jgi:hypothetical protein